MCNHASLLKSTGEQTIKQNACVRVCVQLRDALYLVSKSWEQLCFIVWRRITSCIKNTWKYKTQFTWNKRHVSGCWSDVSWWSGQRAFPTGQRQLFVPLAVSGEPQTLAIESLYTISFYSQYVLHITCACVCCRENVENVWLCVTLITIWKCYPHVLSFTVTWLCSCSQCLTEALPKLTVRRTRPLSSSRRRESAESRDVVAMRMP